MALLIGLLLVLLAGLLQGTFIPPTTLVKQWSWEHTWATFSLLGMFVFNRAYCEAIYRGDYRGARKQVERKLANLSD